MKYFLPIPTLALFLFSGCLTTEDETPIFDEPGNFIKTWKIEKVIFEDSEDMSMEWDSFSITFKGDKTFNGPKSYSTTNAIPNGPWPSQGWVEFVKNGDIVDVHKLVRDDGLVMNLTISGSVMNISFEFDNTLHNAGKFETDNGNYSFIMKSQ